MPRRLYAPGLRGLGRLDANRWSITDFRPAKTSALYPYRRNPPSRELG